MGTHLEGGSAQNYTIGGARFLFDRLLDGSTDPQRFAGYRDVGNIVDASNEQTVDILDHFTSKSGTRRKDRSLVREIEDDIILTLDEPNAENLRLFFRAGVTTDHPTVTATPDIWVTATSYVRGNLVKPITVPGDRYFVVVNEGGTSDAGEPTWPTVLGATIDDNGILWKAVESRVVDDEVIQLLRTDIRVLGGFNAASIEVKSIDDVTTYVLDTDYTVADFIGGYKSIKRIGGGAIADGDFLRVNYVYDIRDHRAFSPSTELEVQGRALFFGVSDTGNEFIRQMALVQIEPEGDFQTFDDEDWSQFQLRVKILDDTDNVPDRPFGLLKHFGTGEDL